MSEVCAGCHEPTFSVRDQHCGTPGCKFSSWTVRIPAAIEKAEGLGDGRGIHVIKSLDPYAPPGNSIVITANQVALAKWAWELQIAGSGVPASEITPHAALIAFTEAVESL